MKLSQLLIVLAVFTATILSAQEKELSVSDVLKQDNIENQFNVVLKKSGNFQDHKVIKQAWIDKLKSNTIDTINALESKLNTAILKIAKQEAALTSLEGSLLKTKEELSLIEEAKNSISFFGIDISKTSYKTINWVSICSLIALLGFFMYKYNESNRITLTSRKTLSDIESEFEAHRSRSLEREQKVMRKLQDELNKQRKTEKAS